MKSKLLLFYSMFLNTYYYNQNKDEKTSKKYAYTAVRNILGAVIFLTSIVIFVVTICVFQFKTDFLNRPVLYLIVGICLYSYVLFTNKFLKPIFDSVEIRKEEPPKNYYFAITIVSLALYGGAMYTLGRLLTTYLCG